MIDLIFYFWFLPSLAMAIFFIGYWIVNRYEIKDVNWPLMLFTIIVWPAGVAIMLYDIAVFYKNKWKEDKPWRN